MDVTAPQGYGAGTAIRGLRTYASQTAFSAPLAPVAKAAQTTASSGNDEADDRSPAETQSAGTSSSRTRSIGFRLGPLAIRYTTEEPEVAPGVSWDDLVSEAERLAAYDGKATYTAEHEVAELRSSLAESPLDRLAREVGEASSQNLVAAEQTAADIPSAAMRRATSAYADAASLAYRTQPGAVWSAIL
ncbi:hypothetical protein DPQ33_13165 [Oceanidesulfovibrio indonesiensis]|uniref:Uncharacterized protein n=1 Tax=Oceanidesulfovibrio indonesiensis TaxID=54767 RepID=A0A7M3MCS8_9BACT|nr:hypothetical protein [Oceanidesulfovibrio indonesiensis]TVM16264.1 hypothetical protein DPQ33_13165 [Oceanidesulfovibrio indonesiensis]